MMNPTQDAAAKVVRRQMSWPIGAGVSLVLLAVAEVVGSQDYESSFRFDSNWGSRYLLTNPFSAPPTTGVIRFFGVGVFDGSQGLGHRMPTFASTNQAHFLSILGDWLPAHLLSLGYVWMAMAFSWATLDLVNKSWNGTSSFAIRVWISSVIATPTFAYLLHNDWLVHLAGLMGVFSVVAALFHRSLWELQSADTQLSTEAVTLLVGSLLLIAPSHPIMWLTIAPVAIWRTAALRCIFRQFRLSIALRLSGLCLLLIAGILAWELKSLELPESAIRFPIQNNFDFLFQSDHLGNWKQFLRSLAMNGALPIFIFAKWIGTTEMFGERNDFINLAALLFAITSLWKLEHLACQEGLRTRALRIALVAIATLIVWMSLTTESQSFPSWLSFLFKADGWLLQYVTAVLILVSCMIGEPTRRPRGVLPLDMSQWSNVLFGSALVLALLLPLAILATAPTLNGEATRRDFRAGLLEGLPTNVIGRGRLADVDRDESAGCMPRTSYEARSGLSHSIVAARSGFPSVESGLSYRAARVGVRESGFDIRCDYFPPSSACNERTLDFLSIGLILGQPRSENCPWLKSVPSFSDYLESIQQRIKIHYASKYGNFYVSSADLNAEKSSDCVLLGDCLASTRRTKSSQANPPWQICETDCWFHYSVLAESDRSGEWLVLPARFDSSARVRSTSAGIDLTTEDYRGLLAVMVEAESSPVKLEVSINPDLRMRLIAVLPYLSLVAFLGLVISLRFRSFSAARTGHARDS